MTLGMVLIKIMLRSALLGTLLLIIICVFPARKKMRSGKDYSRPDLKHSTTAAKTDSKSTGTSKRTLAANASHNSADKDKH